VIDFNLPVSYTCAFRLSFSQGDYKSLVLAF